MKEQRLTSFLAILALVTSCIRPAEAPPLPDSSHHQADSRPGIQDCGADSQAYGDRLQDQGDRLPDDGDEGRGDMDYPNCTEDGVPEPCNGSPALCARRYNEVAHPTTHNAMSNRAEGWLLPNQEVSISHQLADGIRGLMLDIHYYRDDVYLCHEICLGGKKLLVEGLREIRAFLEGHPREVVTIIFESYVSAADTELAFLEAGLLPFLHDQPWCSPWPTLEEMIASGRRLVVLTDQGGGMYPWYHDVWEYAWETNWRAGVIEELNCLPNRGSTDNELFILNHFLSNPVASPDLAGGININPFLIDRALTCWMERGQLPNFPTVDFYDIGDLLDMTVMLNGLDPSFPRLW